MAGSDRVPDPNDSKRAQVGSAKPIYETKWRCSTSACRSVLENCLTPPTLLEMASRVENRRRGFSLPVAADEAFASSPQSGLAWSCFPFPLIEPDRQISRIRLSEKTH